MVLHRIGVFFQWFVNRNRQWLLLIRHELCPQQLRGPTSDNHFHCRGARSLGRDLRNVILVASTRWLESRPSALM